MTKTIFVVGCSFSHHDVYVDVAETWPYLIHQDTNYNIINCSTPGSSNLSYFYRLKFAEQKFGKPDKVIVQLTTTHRAFFHLENKPIQELQQFNNQDYYYDPHRESIYEAGTYFVPNVINDKQVMRRLYESYRITKWDINSFFKYFMSEASQLWQINKEMILIDKYFENCIFFSWRENYNIEVEKYLGSVETDILDKKEFKKYSVKPNKDWHFNSAGHKKLSEVLLEYV